MNRYCLLFLLLTGLTAWGLEPDALLPRSFELPDQDGRLRRCDFADSKWTVLVVADRKGSDQVADWVQVLTSRFASRLAIAGVADVSSVPPLFRGLVRKELKKKSDHPVMLDWKGTVVNRLPVTRGLANVYLVDESGTVALSLSGAQNADKLGQLGAAIGDRPISVP